MYQSTPWHNYALIAHLARRAHGKKLGKTKIQKLMYFLVAVKNIPVDYFYRFHTYGPYCDELAGDVDYLAAINCLNVSFETSTRGYTIEAGEKAEWLENKAQHFIQEHQEEISEVIDRLGSKNVRELELLATLLYLTKQEESCRNSYHNLEQRVQELKPHFSTAEVKKAFSELEARGYVGKKR